MIFRRPTFARSLLLGAVWVFAAACSSDETSSPTPPSSDGGPTDGGRNVEPTGEFAGWPAAPKLGDVTITPNRDSAILGMPAVAGVQDYRVFALGPDVKVTANADGTESVVGATIFCAGRQQHAAPVEERPNDVLPLVEALGIRGTTRFAVEALDRECPFPGLLGNANVDIGVEAEVQNLSGPTFPVRTEASLREKYGSLIVNGQGPAAPYTPKALKSIGLPAAPSAPKVLARGLVEIVPLGTATAPMPFWDDFSDETDQFQVTGRYGPDHSGYYGHLLRNSKWNLYAYDPDSGWVDQDKKQQHVAFVHHGQLTTNAAAMEAMSIDTLIPRQPAHLDDVAYLHVTFEVATYAGDRRYWWFTLCGASQPGKTYNADGTIQGVNALRPFFYEPDGLDPYGVNGWNCLQVFPFEGGYYPLAPDKRRPETMVRVLVNKATEGQPGNRDNVIAVGPTQYGADSNPNCPTCGWYRTWDANHTLTGPMLDDLQYMAPRTKFDLYIRRDRVVLYANGAPKLCNDFPKAKLTMAEGAIGIANLNYHYSAEIFEWTRQDWNRSAMRAVSTIVPWVDSRGWDNVGFQEKVPNLPSGFDEKTCWVSDRTR